MSFNKWFVKREWAVFGAQTKWNVEKEAFSTKIHVGSAQIHKSASQHFSHQAFKTNYVVKVRQRTSVKYASGFKQKQPATFIETLAAYNTRACPWLDGAHGKKQD